MAESIDQAFVQQYQNNIRVLSQQKQSRLEGTTIPPVQMIGEALYWERLGATAAMAMTTRHMDTPNIEPDHTRRKATAQPYVWATLLDTFDQVQMLVDPKSQYAEIMRMAFSRTKDDIIIAALEGNAYQGKTGTTTVALPSAQKIATGSVGLTITKLLQAKEILDEAEVDPDMPRYFVVAAAQVTDLLATTEIKSTDYNSVKALVEGKVDSFMGFKFIRSQRLTLSSTTRYTYAYAQGAVGFGVRSEIETKITQESTKNFAWQIWGKMDMGATRVEDEAVVQVACTES